MAKPELTYNIIHAITWDAGNRSMRQAGRDKWSVDDYNAAADEFNRLMALAGLVPQTARAAEALTALAKAKGD